MKFDKHFPTEKLRDYIKYYVVSENDLEGEYKVFPTSSLVVGFQYMGKLSTLENGAESYLSFAGITGMTDRYKIFKNSTNIGTILVYFTETGFSHFATPPAHELFNLSLSLDEIFDKNSIADIEEKLSKAGSDKHRLAIIEQFFLSQLQDIQADTLVVEAVKLIHQSHGTIRIKELNKKLCISQSPFEKRFRKVVGTSAKKFSSIIRFNKVLDNLNHTKSSTEIGYENFYFDQAHFIKDFKQFTGSTPENFKRHL